jgi:hypothetical protein
VLFYPQCEVGIVILVDEAFTSQKCCLCLSQLVRFNRCRLEICWKHGLVDRDLNSAHNILNKARALIDGNDSAEYLRAAAVDDPDRQPLVVTRQRGATTVTRAAFQAQWMEAQPDASKRSREHTGLKALLASLTSGAVALEAEGRAALPPIMRKRLKAARVKRDRMLRHRDHSRRRVDFKEMVHGPDKLVVMRGNDCSARTIRENRRKFWPLLRAAPLDARQRYAGVILNSSKPAVTTV